MSTLSGRLNLKSWLISDHLEVFDYCNLYLHTCITCIVPRTLTSNCLLTNSDGMRVNGCGDMLMPGHKGVFYTLYLYRAYRSTLILSQTC